MKKAFTLAEVLITLGIIGVVAALTLPTLIQNHQKQTLVNQLKKVINTLNNSFQMAIAEDGVSRFEDTKLRESLDQLIYNCESNCSGYVTDVAKYLNLKYVSIDTSETNYSSNYKRFNGSTYSENGYLRYPIFMTDGSILYNGGAAVDVNGNKGPNQEGRDLFYLNLFGIKEGTVLGDDTSCHWIIRDYCYVTKIMADGWKMNY